MINITTNFCNNSRSPYYVPDYKKATFILTVLLFIGLGAKAQEVRAVSNFQRNNIMFNPLALAFGNFQFEYERPINHNLSLGLGVGIKTSSGLFKIPGFSTEFITTNDFSFSGIQLTPEFRWYTQKLERNHTGFYVGAYYRYQNYKDEIEGFYTSSITGYLSPLDVETNLISNTFGVQIGYKLPIKENFYFDFLIAGPGISFNKIKILENQPLPLEFYIVDVGEAIVDEFAFLEIVNANVHFEETNTDNGKSTFTLPAFKYAIRVGYSF